MTLTPVMTALALLSLFIITLLIVFVVGYLKERFDAFRLKKVLMAKDESILQHAQQEETQKEGRFIRKISDSLWYAGFDMLHVNLFLLLVVLCALCGALFFYLLFDNLFALFIGLLIGGAIPFSVKNRLIEKRVREFNEALSEAMSVVVRMMRNGVGFEVALRRAVEISQSGLFQTLFTKYLQEKDVLSDEKAFENMFRHVDSAELRIFGLAIMIGKSSGGKFSNTLEKLEHSIKQRVLLQKKVTVATREAKVGSYMIVGLLIFIFFILDSNFDGKIIEHFFHTKEGKFEMLMILVWVGLGLLINEKLTKVQQ